jgi:hypothetical protein
MQSIPLVSFQNRQKNIDVFVGVYTDIFTALLPRDKWDQKANQVACKSMKLLDKKKPRYRGFSQSTFNFYFQSNSRFVLDYQPPIPRKHPLISVRCVVYRIC